MLPDRPQTGDSFRKASQAIVARAGAPEFTVLDRKIFNLLLAASVQDRKKKISRHRIAMREIADGLLQGHESMDRIKSSLERLWNVKIEFEYTDEDGDHSVRCHYLSYDMSQIDGGFLEYSFDPMLLKFLMEPKIYATIQLAVSNKFQSGHALRLYEAMQLQSRKHDPVWTCTVEEAKSYFEVADSYDRFDNFKAKVVEKAVEEVNALAEFDVAVEYIRGGRGGKVTGISFRANPKSTHRLMRAGDIPRSPKKRDKHTVDMFAGVTDLERFTPPTLRDDTLATARAIVGADGDHLAYRERWIDERRGAGFGANPDENFLAWLELTVKKERDERLEGIDTDAFFDSLVDQLEG